MKKGKLLFIDSAHPDLKERLEIDGYQCDYYPEFGYDDYKRIIKDYKGLIVRSKIKIDKPILDNATSLIFIARVGAGMENIDFDYAKSKGIVCLNAPEGNRDAVAEQAIGMILSLFNNLNRADQEVRKGIWQREKNRGIELGGKTVGIIGYGNTGSVFAKKLSGFGVDVIAYDKYKKGYSDEFAKETNMNEIFQRSDILSLHIPLSDETTYMVDANFLNQFNKHIYLINTSRGKVVKTTDLVHQLESGKVKGACLDVLEYEGFTFEELNSEKLPEAFISLIKMENVILSPHVAGWTNESNYKMADVILQKIRKIK